MIELVTEPSEALLDTLSAIWLSGNIEAHDFIGAEYWRQHLPEVRELFKTTPLYVASNVAHQVVGFAGVQDDYIAGIFVALTARNKGVGHALIDELKRDRQQLTLSVYKENQEAREFYESVGFVPVATGLDADTGAIEISMQWQKGE